eukprot:6149743-Pyramimonas_sp.AAC.1
MSPETGPGGVPGRGWRVGEAARQAARPQISASRVDSSPTSRSFWSMQALQDSDSLRCGQMEV